MSHPGQLTMILWHCWLHWTKLEISGSCCCLNRKASNIGEYTTTPVRVPWNLLHNGKERMQGPSFVSFIANNTSSHSSSDVFIYVATLKMLLRCPSRQEHSWLYLPGSQKKIMERKCMEWPKKFSRQFFTLPIRVYLLMYIGQQTYSLTGIS